MNSFQTEHDRPDIGSIAELAEHMVYRLPGCADIMIRKTLQQTFSRFCRASCALTTERFIKLKPGVTHYHVDAVTPRMTVDTVCNAWIDGRLLRRDDYAVRMNTILLSPRVAFDEGCVMKVAAVEAPSFGSEDAPRWFLDKYGEAIVSGALVQLFGMTNKPWTDAAQAQAELVNYENFLTTARIDSRVDGQANGRIDALDTSDLL